MVVLIAVSSNPNSLSDLWYFFIKGRNRKNCKVFPEVVILFLCPPPKASSLENFIYRVEAARGGGGEGEISIIR